MVCLFRFKKLKKCSVKTVTFLFASLVMCVVLHAWMMRDVLRFVDNIGAIAGLARRHRDTVTDPKQMKHALLWDRYHLIIPWNGQSIFPSLNCSVSNCIFTENKGLLGDYSLFDAIIFNQDHLLTAEGRPRKRNSSQLYIFTTVESSANIPACELFNDDYFNWTFTFRLDSDIVWNYFVVRNISGSIVAPSRTVAWELTNYPINEQITSIFQGRKRVAAWIVSNCHADSLRDDYLTKLQEHLFHYSLKIDVYGRCTNLKCDDNDCETMLRNNYYFYMAFENSFADDYVTEKVLHGYDNYVVPIVYGGANYSRFLPPSSYINALEYHPYHLATIMYQAVKDHVVYESFFRWTNSYTIDADMNIYHPLCDLCEALNSKRAKHAPPRRRFRLWWNTLGGMKWCLPKAYWNETSRVNIDGKHVYGNKLY